MHVSAYLETNNKAVLNSNLERVSDTIKRFEFFLDGGVSDHGAGELLLVESRRNTAQDHLKWLRELRAEIYGRIIEPKS